MALSKDFIQFKYGLEKHISKTFSNLLLRSEAEEQAVITKHLQPTESSNGGMIEKGLELQIKIPRVFRKRDLIKYSILSWYVPSLTQFELQEILRQKSVQLHLPEIQSYLYSKEVMLATLYLEIDYNKNDLFGNILQNGIYNFIRTDDGKRKKIKIKDQIILSTKHRNKPRKKVYRRGYNDHGSLPPFDEVERRKVLRESESLSILQARIELQRTYEKITASNRIMKGLEFLKTEGVEG